MNITGEIVAQSSTTEVDWVLATSAVNAWHGRMLHLFSQTEQAVSEALLSLSQVSGRGAAVQLRLLVGHRFQDLHDALASDGPFAEAGEAGEAAA